MGFIKPNKLKLDTTDLALHGINDNSEIVGNNNASNADAPAQTFVLATAVGGCFWQTGQ